MAPGTSGRTLRKQQTRLSFDPIEESSSQSTMPPAKVRYEVPGATRRFTHRTSRQNPLNENKTSPAEKGVVAFDKSPRKKKGRKLMSSQTLPQMMSSQTHGLVNEGMPSTLCVIRETFFSLLLYFTRLRKIIQSPSPVYVDEAC